MHGNTSDAAALIKAIRSNSILDAPRGPIEMDSYGNPIENVYIRKVEDKNGTLQNTVIRTYPKVSQFWTWPARAIHRAPSLRPRFTTLQRLPIAYLKRRLAR